MNARHKLNQAYFNGVLFSAILIGYCFQSLWVFAASAIVLLLSAWNLGDLRAPGQTVGPSSRKNRRRRRW